MKFLVRFKNNSRKADTVYTLPPTSTLEDLEVHIQIFSFWFLSTVRISINPI